MTSSPNTNVTRESKPRDTPLSHEELLKLFSIVDPCRSGPRDKIQWRKHPSLEHDIYEELHISRTQAQNYLSRNKHLKRPLPTQSQSASVVTRSNSSKTRSMLNNDADTNSNDNIVGEDDKYQTTTSSTNILAFRPKHDVAEQITDQESSLLNAEEAEKEGYESELEVCLEDEEKEQYYAKQSDKVKREELGNKLVKFKQIFQQYAKKLAVKQEEIKQLVVFYEEQKRLMQSRRIEADRFATYFVNM